MRPDLTDGALRLIMRGAKIEDPIMQVLGSKKIPSHSDKERYRMLLSDGRYLISFAMLHTSGKEVEKFSIVKLKQYITSVINNTSAKSDKRVLVIMELDIVVPGDEVGERIGDPQQISDEDVAGDADAAGGSADVQPPAAKRPATVAAVQASRSMAADKDVDISLQDRITCPISSLSPYQNKWVIKAMVTNKSALKEWNNSRGSGKLFSVDLLDDSGEIRCTAFREQAEKYYDFIEIDKTYYISRCQIKLANKQFTNLKNDYEMTFTNETVVQVCNEVDTTISAESMYNFVAIDKISAMESGTLVDVLAVCKSVSEIHEFIAKSSGREMKKREVCLVDQSNHEITLAIWGKDADEFPADLANPVIALRGAKLGEYLGGKNITTAGGSVKVNPDIAQAHKLKGWFNTEGKDAQTTNLSTRTGSGTGSFDTPWMTFRELSESHTLGKDPRGDYFQVYGCVSLVRTETMAYRACPQPDCNKKVRDEGALFKCEKCQKSYEDFKYRLLPSMFIVDCTGGQWMTMFNDVAEKLFECSATEVGQAMDSGLEDQINAITGRVSFKQGVFKCRAKMEMFNDEMRLKTVLINYEEIKPDLGLKLIKDIELITGLSLSN